MSGYVYLIGSPVFHWYKIGKSHVPAIRIKDLGILLPFKVEVVAVWKSDNYHNLERTLHEQCSACRINGEWFRFTDKQISDLLLEVGLPISGTMLNFSNIERDAAPDGHVPKLGFVKDLTDAEREERKNKAIAEKASRETCTECGRRLPRQSLGLVGQQRR